MKIQHRQPPLDTLESQGEQDSTNAQRNLSVPVTKRPRRLWNRFLATLTAPIILGDIDRLTKINGVFFYHLYSGNTLDLRLLENTCFSANLPAPQATGLGPSIARVLRPKSRFGNSLSSKSVDPQLVNLQKLLKNTPSENVWLIPVQCFWYRAPRKEKSLWQRLFSENMRSTACFSRCIAICFNRRHITLEFGAPISLRKWFAHNRDNQATQRLHDSLCEIFYSQHQIILGPMIARHGQMVKAIQQSPRVTKAITTRGKTDNYEHYKKQAKDYALEIPARLSYPFIRLVDHFMRYFCNRIFDQIIVTNIANIRSISSDHTLIYVPCHRSHMDYLLMTVVLFYSGLTVPHIAAGKNLNIPIIGNILKRCGAFFVRRTFSGVLYTAVLHEYMHQMYQRKYPIEYFIEGGRSRTGQLQQPEIGMLSMSLLNYLEGNQAPVAFVPINIAYEKIPETGSYARELQGATKTVENLKGVFNSIRRLGRQFGSVQISFAPAIKLTEFLDKYYPESTTDNSKSNPEWLKPATHSLGCRILESINSVTLCNATQMIAFLVLSAPNYSISENELCAQMELLKKLISLMPFGDHIIETDTSACIDKVESMGFLIRDKSTKNSPILSCSVEKANELNWYSNNIQHIFVVPSLLIKASRHIPKEVAIRLLCQELYPYIKVDYFLPWTEIELDSTIDKYLDAFRTFGIQQEANGHLSLASKDQDKQSIVDIISNTITPTLIRYLIALQIISESWSDETYIPELTRRCLKAARHLKPQHETEVLKIQDKNSFQLFISQLNQKNLVTMGAELENQQKNQLSKLAQTIAPLVQSSFQAMSAPN